MAPLVDDSKPSSASILHSDESYKLSKMASSSFASDAVETVVCSVVVEIQNFSRIVGLVGFDFIAKRLRLCQFEENEHFTCLEGVCLQMRPSEVIFKITSGGLRATDSSQKFPIDTKKVKNLFESSGVPIVDETCTTNIRFRPHSGAGTTEQLEHDLRRLLHRWDSPKNHTAELRQTVACRALQRLIAQWGLLQNESNFEQCSLDFYPLECFMCLDKASFSALAILPGPHESTKSPTSLLGLLNRCRTVTGGRRLARWITQPLVDPVKISERHDIVEFIIRSDSSLVQVIQLEYLNKIPDLDKIILKLHQTVGLDGLNSSKELTRSPASPQSHSSLFSSSTLEDLVRLYECIIIAHALHTVLQRASAAWSEVQATDDFSCRPTSGTSAVSRKTVLDSVCNVILTPLASCLKNFEGYLKLVDHAIDVYSDEIGKKYTIKQKLDAELARIGCARAEIWDRIEKHRKEVERDLRIIMTDSSKSISTATKVKATAGRRSVPWGGGCSDAAQNIKIVSLGGWGEVFRVTKSHQQLLQAHSKKYKQVKINKADFLFTTRTLMDLSAELEEKSSHFETRQKVLIAKALSVASTYWPVVEQLTEILSSLDIFVAFAVVSTCGPLPYCRPEIDLQGQEVILEESRHALAEMQLNLNSVSSQSDGNSCPVMSKFVANDVNMSRTNATWVQIITGPNMGGKSTYIRQVALVALLCQIGSWVPCKRAKLPIFSHLLCRIGSSDVQLRGISTFFAEMIEAAAITRTATSSSLLIIDELGRGTSTAEGFGLAWAIARHVAENLKSFCLFATHFHEIAQLANQVVGVVNYHVTISIQPDATEKTNPNQECHAAAYDYLSSQAKEYDEAKKSKITFLYNLRPGAADKSFGISVAELAGLPVEVIRRAKQKIGELEVAEVPSLLMNQQKVNIDSTLIRQLDVYDENKENGNFRLHGV